jgi:hypothetical protein
MSFAPITPSRDISEKDTRNLWTRSAGRCEFNGCNRVCYRSPITQEDVNIAERAHIWSFSEDGPRGRGKYTENTEGLNSVDNLMLLCHDCHKSIDQDTAGDKYSASLLYKWKFEHEKRIYINTGVSPQKKSNVIIYSGNIGAEKSKITPSLAHAALFPNWYPAEERPTEISMNWSGRDTEPHYWATEEGNLTKDFIRKIEPLLSDSSCAHFSLFGFAPMPLLMKFGALLTDKPNAQTYQLHREPRQSWNWQESKTPTKYQLNDPIKTDGIPTLVISLSAQIKHEQIYSVLSNASIWEFTIAEPNNDFIKSETDLSSFREAIKVALSKIEAQHGKSPLHIFPAMPVSCAIDLGRVRMPKADAPWIVYDYNNTNKTFVNALQIS